MSLVRSGASASIPTCDASKTVADLPPKRGPVRILCDEIGFQFEPRLERPEVLIAFVRELVEEVAALRHLAEQTASYTGKKPSEESAGVLAVACAMAALELGLSIDARRDMASVIHDRSHDINPDDPRHKCDHLVDMLSSCASAIRFGLEALCHSRHAAEASNHVWKHVYGVTRFDKNTSSWQREWARSKLQAALASLLPAEARTAVEGPSVGTQGEARSETKTLPTNGDSQ